MADYIPATDGPLFTWMSNFVTVLTAQSTTLGLSAAQMTELSALNTGWLSARTDKIGAKSVYDGSVAAETTAQDALVTDVRTLVGLIQKSPYMTDDVRRQLGITVPKTSNSSVPVPATFPILSASVAGPMMHTLSFADSATPNSKAKPDGVMACELRELIVAAGGATPVDPDQMPFLAMDTRTPYGVTHSPTEAGKTAYYAGRWTNTKGETGPWGTIVSLTVAG